MTAAVYLVGLLGCGVDPEPDADPTPSSTEARLVRASMSLRGVRPTDEELTRVRADPASFEPIVAAYLDDPRFGETIRDMHAEQLHLRWDVLSHIAPMGPLADVPENDLLRSLDESPLKLIEWVVTSGRPYSEIVTSDVVYSDSITAMAYGLEFDPEGLEWQQTSWPDGRPAAGILNDNGFLIRYPSSEGNSNRSRGNAVAEIVCDPLTQRPLPLDVYDPGEGNALTENAGCVACHAVLEPLAASYWSARVSLQPQELTRAYRDGCPPDQAWACYPVQLWDESGEIQREELGLPEPAFYGTPVSDLGDLGRNVAEDPRFASCTVRRFWSWFTQTPITEVPFDVWSPLTEEFVASGLDARALALRVATHPSFDEVISVRPDQYARMIEDLTGHRWIGVPDGAFCGENCIGEIDLARNSRYGNHTLMGGADGYFVVNGNPDPSPARFLAQWWFAEEAAAHVVDADLAADPADRRLLRAADPFDTSPEAVTLQLGYLHARILAEYSPDLAQTELLFRGALDRHQGDVGPAWKLVITALLLDMGAVTY